MIIFDLEWNRGYDAKPLNEILQIGAVRLGPECGPILDTFCRFIRPRVHKKFDIGAKKLPELDESLRSQTDFPAAVADFLDWCRGETEFAAWGGGDFQTLAKNCGYYGLPFSEPGVCYDVQTAFARRLGAGDQQMALWKAVDYCLIPDVFCYHNALNDAMYTALLAGVAGRELLLGTLGPKEKAPKSLRLSRLPFPPQPRRRGGPFQSLNEALDSRESRSPACPLCGETRCVQQWRTADSRQFFAVFRCPEHGRFLCRLTVARGEDGLWRSRLAVPSPTEETLRQCRAAMAGEEHRCGRLPRKRRSRRRKKAPAAREAG